MITYVYFLFTFCFGKLLFHAFSLLGQVYLAPRSNGGNGHVAVEFLNWIVKHLIAFREQDCCLALGDRRVKRGIDFSVGVATHVVLLLYD